MRRVAVNDPRRSARLWGFLTPAGRREPCHGWGLRIAQWRGVPVDQMRISGPCGWEREAATRWREHVNRLQGCSAGGIQRELLRLGSLNMTQSVSMVWHSNSTGVNDRRGRRCVLEQPSHLSRGRMDNTPAWVSRQTPTRTGQKRVFTGHATNRLSPSSPNRWIERQGASYGSCGSVSPA